MLIGGVSTLRPPPLTPQHKCRGACSGLTLSGALHTLLKNRLWGRRMGQHSALEGQYKVFSRFVGFLEMLWMLQHILLEVQPSIQ